MKGIAEELIQDRIKYLRDNTDFVTALFESLIGYAIIAADFDGNVIAYNEAPRKPRLNYLRYQNAGAGRL